MQCRPAKQLFFTMLIVMAEFETYFILFISHSHIDPLVENEVYKDRKGCAGDFIQGIENIIVIAHCREAILQIKPECKETCVDILIEEPLDKVTKSDPKRSSVPEQQAS